MKATDFIDTLKQKGKAGLTRPLLFLGEEDYWVEVALNLIKDLLFKEEEEEFNLVIVEVKETEAPLLATELANPPFFGQNRLLILKGLEDLKTAQEGILLAALPHLAPGVFLILTARQLNPQKKLFKQIKTLVETVDCAPFKAYEAKRWVARRAQELGLNLSPRQTDLLLEMKGTSLLSLENELEKLKTYCGDDEQRISMEEWGSLLGEASETNIFQMIDDAVEGNVGTALNLLHRLLRAGEPEMKILALLGTEIRRLYLAWALQATGRASNLQKELACHPYVAEKIGKQARRLTYEQLRRAHRRILTADYRLKTGRSEPELELEAVIYDLGSFFTKKTLETRKPPM